MHFGSSIRSLDLEINSLRPVPFMFYLDAVSSLMEMLMSCTDDWEHFSADDSSTKVGTHIELYACFPLE